MTLCVENLTIRNNSSEILFNGLNLTVEAGQIATLMGPSGCGKSTLLSLIAGHLASEFNYSGHIRLSERDLCSLAPHQRQVGILFQDDLLFPHLNVWQNLAFALPNSVKGKHRETAALQALDTIKLAHLASSAPNQISGGQRARISLTRMLLAKPQLALLDEPFSKLDAQIRAEFRHWVFEQLRQANIPAILVTHDQQDTPSDSQILHWPWRN